MMEFVRTHIKDSFILKIFMGLLMVSFGIWGVGDFLGTGGLDPTIALKVGKTEVSTDEFQRRYNHEIDRFRQQVGLEAAQQEGVKRSVVNSLVQDVTQTATIDNAADDMGIVITPDRLRQAVRDENAFKDPTGNFSQSAFSQVLAQNGLNEKGFLKIYASGMRENLLVQPLGANSAAPKYLVDSLFAYRNETRVADTLLLPLSAIAITKVPTNDELKAIYDQNVSVFTAPEYRKLSAVVLTGADLVKPESIEEADVKKYYDENTAHYQTKEKRQIVQLVFDSKEKADAAKALAAPGESLATVAAKAKLPPPVDFGDVAVGSPMAKTLSAAFELPVKQISDPIQDELGWHLFEVKSITPQATTPYDEVKDAIRKSMAEEKGNDAVYAASVQLEDAVAGGTPLSEVAHTVGGRFIQVDAVDRDGKDPRGLDVPNLVDQNAFLRTAFSTASGADSGLKDLSTHTGYYVLKVDGITPPAPKPMEDVRGEVAAIWTKQTRLADAQAVIEKTVGEVTPSVTMTALEAADKRLSYAQLGPLTRFGEGLDRAHAIDPKRVSPELLQKLFAAKVGDVVSAPVNDGMVVARLREVVAPTPIGPLAQAEKQLTDNVRSSIGNELVDEMTRAFAKRYPADINTKIIDQMVGQR